MKITARYLKRIILEEIKNVNRQRLQEGTAERPIRITPDYLNRIIREEYEAHQKRQRLAEARRRRRRIAESRRRRLNRY